MADRQTFHTMGTWRKFSFHKITRLMDFCTIWISQKFRSTLLLLVSHLEQTMTGHNYIYHSLPTQRAQPATTSHPWRKQQTARGRAEVQEKTQNTDTLFDDEPRWCRARSSSAILSLFYAYRSLSLFLMMTSMCQSLVHQNQKSRKNHILPL
jgi:hypothetical protein